MASGTVSNTKMVEVTDFFSSTAKLSTYTVYRVGNIFIITVFTSGAIGSGWQTVATVNANKYQILLGGAVMGANGQAYAHMDITTSGEVRRYYQTDVNAGFNAMFVVPVRDVS